MNANVVLREDIDAEQFIDVLEGNKKYIPSVVALNKIDMADEKQIEMIKRILKPDVLISAEMKINLDELKEMVFHKLNLIATYLFVLFYCQYSSYFYFAISDLLVYFV